MCGCFWCAPYQGPGLATQACALTGNRTGDPLVHRPVLNSLSHPARAIFLILCNKMFLYFFHTTNGPILCISCYVGTLLERLQAKSNGSYTVVCNPLSLAPRWGPAVCILTNTLGIPKADTVCLESLGQA